MKICSFLLTATAMLYTLGLEGAVSGVTHECEFAPEARQKPVVLRSIFDPAQHSSAEIDRLVRESLGRGGCRAGGGCTTPARAMPGVV